MIYNQSEPQSVDAKQRIQTLADKLNITLVALPFKHFGRCAIGDTVVTY